MTSDIIQRVNAKLDEVLDPCSCLTEMPLSIVELGLVEDITVEGGAVEVELVPTTPMCLYMGDIIKEAESEIGRLEDIEEVTVAQNIENLWYPDRMDDELRREKTKGIEVLQRDK